YQGLPCSGAIRRVTRVEGSYDAVILLECDSIDRSRLKGLEGRVIINIDHHASGRAFGSINWIDTSSCAVAEMVYDLATLAGVEITPDMATCLYTAVLTDTGSFCYSSTDAHTSIWPATWCATAPTPRSSRSTLISRTPHRKCFCSARLSLTCTAKAASPGCGFRITIWSALPQQRRTAKAW